jgi:hypothetical protein
MKIYSKRVNELYPKLKVQLIFQVEAIPDTIQDEFIEIISSSAYDFYPVAKF